VLIDIALGGIQAELKGGPGQEFVRVFQQLKKQLRVPRVASSNKALLKCLDIDPLCLEVPVEAVMKA